MASRVDSAATGYKGDITAEAAGVVVAFAAVVVVDEDAARCAGEGTAVVRGADATSKADEEEADADADVDAAAAADGDEKARGCLMCASY